MEIKEFIEKNLDQMKLDLANLVKYESVNSDDVLPFGLQNRLVLDEALNLFKRVGLEIKNEDYYCGYGQTGEGDKLIGILAHLDVVPLGTGWNTNPLKMEEKDGYLYGRGVSDDKGAVIAALYALKYLIDEKYEFKKRVRLIVGCNEETGSECIKHYVEKNGHIDYGFTPDGNFPGIFAEKGMVGAAIVSKSNILDLKTGEASNVVPKEAVFTLVNDSFDETLLDKFFKENNITYTIKKDNNTILTVYGKAAHASTPHLGINALSMGMLALKASGYKDDLVDFYCTNFGLDYNGKKLGQEEINDEYTNTTINLGGICKKENGQIMISLDERFPVKSNSLKAKSYLEKISNNKVQIVIVNTHEPLFFDKDNNPMIIALKKAYEDVTGDKESQMEAIGGGTYAKAINNCIAFGCEFKGEENHIHDANECLNIENFKKQIEIYVQAIKNLNNL